MTRATLLLLAATSSYSVLTVILVGLRLAGAIQWSWLWVLTPLWLPLGVLAVALAGLLLLERVD
jgi:hypothetical protein